MPLTRPPLRAPSQPGLPALERAAWTPVSLPLRRALATSRGAIRHRTGFVLELWARDGTRGLADCLPLPGFGLESLDAAGEALARGLAALDPTPRDLDEALDRIEETLRDRPAARACLDVALHDLAARGLGRTVAALRGPALSRVPVAALLGETRPEASAQEAVRLVRAGFRTLKLKLGAVALADDLERARAVRDAVGTGIRLRFDVNGAWAEAQAREGLAGLAALEPEWVEEPLRDATPHTLAELRRACAVPLAADESLRDAGRARALLEAGAVDALVLKPAAVGGLREAWRIADEAAPVGVAVVVTSFLDAAPGLAAALQLAASLRGPARAAGLATDTLLARDLAPLPPIRDGARDLPGGCGLGLRLAASRLDAVRAGATRELCFP